MEGSTQNMTVDLSCAFRFYESVFSHLHVRRLVSGRLGTLRVTAVTTALVIFSASNTHREPLILPYENEQGWSET
jgi:hypothetical protein